MKKTIMERGRPGWKGLPMMLGILAVVMVGMWLRFWHLDAAPPAFYHDEMDHVFTGQAVALWGTDVTGNWSPWQFRPLKTLNYTSEWGPLFHGIMYKIAGHGVYQARLTNAVFGLLTVLGISALAYLVTRKMVVAGLSLILMLTNPWHVHISRLGYEGTISLFFLTVALIGLWGIWREKLKGRYLMAWALGAIGSYFSYHGAKFTVGMMSLPFILLMMKDGLKSKSDRRLITYGLIVSLMLGSLYLHTVMGNRQGWYGKRSTNDTLSMQMVEETVNLKRRDRIPSALDQLMVNKLTETVAELKQRYAFVFDTYRLWLEGVEGGYQFSLIVGGYFGVWVIVGLLSHLTLSSREPYFGLLWLLIAISPIATVVGSGRQALLRSGLTYALMLMAAAWGLYSLFKYLNKRVGSGLVKFMFLLVLLGESFGFGMNYFAQYPLLAANNHTLDGRLVSRYLKSIDEEVTVVVMTNPYSTAREYVYYNNLMPTLTAEEKAQFEDPKGSVFQFGKVKITTDCPKTDLGDDIWVINGGKWTGCEVEALLDTYGSARRPRIGIPSPLDNGTYYTVWNDPVCLGKTKLQSYIRLNSLSDLSIEQMSDEEFCSVWVKQE